MGSRCPAFWLCAFPFVLGALGLVSAACGGDDDTTSAGDRPLACTLISQGDAQRVLGGAVGEPEGDDRFAPNVTFRSNCEYRLRERDDDGRDRLEVHVLVSTQTLALSTTQRGPGFSASVSGDGVQVTTDAANAKKAPLKSEVEALAKSVHAKAKGSCIVNSKCNPRIPAP